MFGLFAKQWNPEGLHAYITGGSTGLGFATAKILVSKGAHVSIVARRQSKLDEAIEKLQQLRVSPAQLINAYSFALDTASEAEAALNAVCAPHGGRAPDIVFTCAGCAKPMFFVEMTEKDMFDGMTNAFWLQAWTVWAVAKRMVWEEKKGKIVFVSSTLGYMSYVGWSSYSPGKFALRGLADSLHSELMLYGIDVHIFFPPTMYTPSYEEENKTKPKISFDIESADDGMTADQAALALYQGVEKGQAHITGDLITSLFRASTRGATPYNNWILDGIYGSIAFVAMPFWRSSVDRKVIAHRNDHREHLVTVGFLS